MKQWKWDKHKLHLHLIDIHGGLCSLIFIIGVHGYYRKLFCNFLKISFCFQLDQLSVDIN